MGRKAILISGFNRSISSELYIIVSENMESYVKNNKKVSKLILLALSMIKDILKRNKEKSLVILHIDYRTYVPYNAIELQHIPTFYVILYGIIKYE